MATIYGSNTLSSGFTVANSCRFDEGSSDNLSANSFGTPTSDKIYTLSWWFKRSKFGEAVYQFGWYDGSRTNSGDIVFDAADTLSFYHGSDDGNGKLLMPNRLFRDPSAWTHVVWAVDTTQGTASNRIKIYFNGVQETSFSTEVYPDQNAVSKIFHDSNNRIGAQWNAAGTTFYNGYMAEIVFIDGQQLAPTSFGEFDEDSPNIWKPIDVSDLTFGTSGFYLDFEDSSNLGNDANGGTDFTEVNLAATDQSTDTCTNNFATLNNLIYGANYTFSESNLQFAQTATNWDTTYSSIGVTKGKWYMEFKGKVGAYYDVGVTDVIDPTNNLTVNSGCVAFKSNGEFARGGAVGDGLPSTITNPASNTYTADDIIGIAIDVDNEAVYFAKNGTYEVNSDPTSGATKTGATTLPNSNSTYFFAFAAYKGGAASGTGQVNFGGGSVDAISSGNADADGHGNFEHAPPSGYFALCTKNLAEYG